MCDRVIFRNIEQPHTHLYIEIHLKIHCLYFVKRLLSKRFTKYK